jgi:hypothetical protein
MSDLRKRLQDALSGTYEVERELGGAGMSRVFVALDRELGRRVVVKVLPPERAARVDVGRFRREIQLAASLQHPHIVPLLTAHRAADLVYYTMPLIEGESLRVRLDRDGALPPRDAIRILRDVVDAISHAHTRGLVHRDIKPDNVLVSGQHALVTDFGVAKALSQAGDAPTVTTQMVAVGTPAYMAPEQAMADPHIDQRVDIYAVGALAYELLSGRPPFTAITTQEVLAAHVHDAPVPLSKLAPKTPPALARLVMRCLEKNPADRWQTAQELLAELEALTTPGGGIRVWPRLKVRTKRARHLVVAAGVVMAVALGAVALARVRGHRGAAVLDPDVVAVFPFRVSGADTSVANIRAQLREGMVPLLAAKLSGRSGLQPVDPRTMLVAWREAAGSPDANLSPEAALAVARRLGAGRVVLGELSGTRARLAVTAAVLSTPDGRTTGQATVHGPIDSLPQLVDQLARQLLALGLGSRFGWKIAFVSSRDRPDVEGRQGNQEIYVMNADGSDQTRLTEDDAIDAAPAWSPDGRRIAFASSRGGGVDIYLMNADGTDPTRLTNMMTRGLGARIPAWSPDGRKIAFATALQPDIYVINVDGTGLRSLTTSPATDDQPAWSPDGSKIAFQSNRDGNLEIYVMNADGAQPVRLTFNQARDLSPDWSPDGRRIAFASDRDGDQEIYVMNADGSAPVRLTFNPGEDGRPGWSPDGGRIVFHRRVLGHLQVFTMNADGTEQTRLTEPSLVAFNGFPSWGKGRASRS